MTTTERHLESAKSELFTNVHKGIRRALFDACVALGRALGEPAREQAARATLAEALRFVAHHGENEDLLLLPMVRDRAPEVHARMTEEHGALDAARAALGPERPIDLLYLEACAFTAKYLAHMDEEERVFEPRILAVLTPEEAASFSRGSVARTAPADQRMMVGWMLPAMTRADAEAFLGKVPPGLAAELRGLLDAPRLTTRSGSAP